MAKALTITARMIGNRTQRLQWLKKTRQVRARHPAPHIRKEAHNRLLRYLANYRPRAGAQVIFSGQPVTVWAKAPPSYVPGGISYRAAPHNLSHKKSLTRAEVYGMALNPNLRGLPRGQSFPRRRYSRKEVIGQ